MPRDQLAERLADSKYLVLTGPHRLGPVGLATWLTAHGAVDRVRPVAQLTSPTGTWAYVFRLDDPDVDAIPTVLTTTAAEHMLAEGKLQLDSPTVIAGAPDALARLAPALPAGSYEPLPAPLR